MALDVPEEHSVVFYLDIIREHVSTNDAFDVYFL